MSNSTTSRPYSFFHSLKIKGAILLCSTFLTIIFLSAILSTATTANHWALSSLLHNIFSTFQWSAVQISRSIIPTALQNAAITSFLDTLEEKSWAYWENEVLGAQEYENITLSVTVIDFNNIHTNNGKRQCLSELDIQQPILLRGLWNKTELNRPDRHLSLHGLTQEPLSTIPVSFFTDATLGRLDTDAVAPLGEIVANITSGGKQKIGSQVPILTFPELIEEVAPADIVRELFGDRFRPGHVKGSGPFRAFPAWTTVPMFLASGGALQHQETIHDVNAPSAPDSRPRTDFHCEPIGNVAVQLHGEKRWTLVSPEFSMALRPSISRQGRAFFYSMFDFHSISSIPHYEVFTRAGDALWVPPWMWHRVDYVEGSVALAASLFHFRPWDFFKNNFLFATLVLPNLFQEILGSKTE